MGFDCNLPGKVDEVELPVPHDLLSIRHALLDHDLQCEDRVASRRVLVHERLRGLSLLYALAEDGEYVFCGKHLHLFQPKAYHPCAGRNEMESRTKSRKSRRLSRST